MRRVLMAVLVLAMCGPVLADDDDDDDKWEDLQPAKRTVVFHKEWFNPWNNVGTTSFDTAWPAPRALGDLPPRPSWPGKIGVITAPMRPFPPLAPYTSDVEPFRGSYTGLR